ncbi:MAG: TolC family protein [Candidatus Omnitrophica bacterium]|nr:TolC family protein [Candidatus Omnitrophota bacterium]
MKIIFLLFFLFLFSFYALAEAIQLTIDEAISIGLRENKEILLKYEDLKKAKYKLKESYSAIFPSITATGVVSKTTNLYQDKEPTQTSSQISLKQNLYKGGKIINTIKYNQYGLDIAQTILDKTKLEVIFNIKKAFYTLLLTGEFVNLNKAIYKNTKRHLLVIKKRFKHGETSSSDILKLEESLAIVKEAYQVSINQKKVAEAVLKNFLSLEDNVDIVAKGDFVYTPKELIYEKAYLEALNNRPEIKQYSLSIEASKKLVDIAKADAKPTIYASWDYYVRSHNVSFGGLSKNWNDYSQIVLGISWPIFDGWLTKAKIEEALIDLKEAQIAKEKLIKDIELELKNAYLELQNAIYNLETIVSEVNKYKDILKSIRQKYKVGIASLLDLEDAYLSYKVSLFKRKQAIYDYIIQKAKFDKATGGAI